MFCDPVRGERYLGATREILYCIAAAFALFGADGDDERNMHFVGLAHLIADTLSGKIHCDGHVLSPQILGELYSMISRFLIDDGYHQLRCGSIRGEEIMRFEEVACGDVSHTKSHGGNAFVFTGEESYQVVVAPAAKDRATVVFARVVYLKDHPRVVIEAARYLGVHDHIAHAHVLEHC